MLNCTFKRALEAIEEGTELECKPPPVVMSFGTVTERMKRLTQALGISFLRRVANSALLELRSKPAVSLAHEDPA